MQMLATIRRWLSRSSATPKAIMTKPLSSERLNWLVERATAEWVQLFAADLFPLLRENKQLPELQKQILASEQLRSFLNDYTRLLMG